jgi:hypothetical protein
MKARHVHRRDEEANRFPGRLYDIAFDIDEAQKERCSGIAYNRILDMEKILLRAIFEGFFW